MLYDLDITKQRKQFTNVIDHLLETGHKQKDIAKKIGLNSYDISHLISGSIKNIPYEVIENLHDEFEIMARAKAVINAPLTLLLITL